MSINGFMKSFFLIFFFTYNLCFKKHLRLDVVFDEVIHNHVVAVLGNVQGCCLLFGEDIAVCSILQ